MSEFVDSLYSRFRDGFCSDCIGQERGCSGCAISDALEEIESLTEDVAQLTRERDSLQDSITAAERESDLWRVKYAAVCAERDKNLPYHVDPHQQTCKVCGRPMKLGFHVPDTVWKMIVPEEHHNHAVCLYCFDEFAHKEGIECDVDMICFGGKTVHLSVIKEDAERLKELERERDEWKAACAAMREALKKAVEVIRQWHGMRMAPQGEEQLWHIYWNNAPELQPIREALSSTAGQKMLERLRKAEAAVAPFRKCLQGLVDAIRELEDDIPDSALCLGYYGDHMEVALPLLASDAGKTTLAYIERLEKDNETARALLKAVYDECYMLDPMGSGRRVLSGPPKRATVDAIDAYLKEVEGK